MKSLFQLPKVKSLFHSQPYLVLSDQLLVSGANFLFNLMVTRGMGLSGLGYMASVWMYQSLLLSLQNALIVNPMQLRVAQQQGSEQKIYLSGLLALQSGWSLLTCLITWPLLSFSHFLNPEPDLAEKLWLIAWTVGYTWLDFLRKLYISLGKAFISFKLDGISQLLQLGVLGLLFSLEKPKMADILPLLALSQLPSLLMGTLPLLSGIKAQVKSCAQLHWKEGRWLGATALLQWLAGNYYLLVAARYLGMESLGAIRMAQTLMGIFSILFQAFENYVPTQLAKKLLTSRQAFRQQLGRLTAHSLWLIVSLSLVLGLLARPLLELIGGSTCGSSVPIFRGFLLLNILIFLGYPIRTAIRTLEMSRDVFIAYVLTTLLSWLMAPLLISNLESLGVVLGLALNQFLLIAYLGLRLHFQHAFFFQPNSLKN
jgi:O-antigen/teichoic acid export membrane protein